MKNLFYAETKPLFSRLHIVHCKIQNRKVTGNRWNTLTTRNEIGERLGFIVTDSIVLFDSNC